jgi:hypothetical protein
MSDWDVANTGGDSVEHVYSVSLRDVSRGRPSDLSPVTVDRAVIRDRVGTHRTGYSCTTLVSIVIEISLIPRF